MLLIIYDGYQTIKKRQVRHQIFFFIYDLVRRKAVDRLKGTFIKVNNIFKTALTCMPLSSTSLNVTYNFMHEFVCSNSHSKVNFCRLFNVFALNFLFLKNTNERVHLSIAGQEKGRYAKEEQRGSRAQSLVVQVTTQRASGEIVSVPPLCLQHVPTGLQCACVLVVATIYTPVIPFKHNFIHCTYGRVA
jgi:hypothetical protein